MRAPLHGQAAVLAALLALSTCLTGSHLCPRSLDCARAGRHFCEQGSSHCGPCLRPLVENSHGRCVVKRRHTLHSAQATKGKMSTYPELDEEIDILSAIISEQRTESRPPAPPSQDISTPKSKQLSEPSGAHRASTAEQPTSQDVPFTSMAPTTITPHHTPTLLNDPIVLPYLSNDHAFISKYFLAMTLFLVGIVLLELKEESVVLT
ncbi:neural proliferation differentiation and control protein 1-like [Micropterus salmoides]|uniref:neural proliferation differentiation and control protein 1-like n=1 Tax=Micropterus salmoides TaxID=27706 RepID=UPI0018EE3D31|nr:neural proliferation differentiation and control protein 1-like [Micropterus salmoides]